MKVLVCGGRRYSNYMRAYAVLDKLHAKVGITCIVCGGDKGADRLGYQWSMRREIKCVTVPAEWLKLNTRAAGPIRNTRMLDEETPDCVVAFPGGSGTRDMCAQSEERGTTVYRIDWRK